MFATLYYHIQHMLLSSLSSSSSSSHLQQQQQQNKQDVQMSQRKSSITKKNGKFRINNPFIFTDYTSVVESDGYVIW